MIDLINIHIWSANFLLLMFLIASVGYILRDKELPDLTSSLLFKFYYILIAMLVISGIYLISNNDEPLTHIIYWIKIFMTIVLVGISVVHYYYKRIKPIIFIILFIIIYSISMMVGSITNV